MLLNGKPAAFLPRSVVERKPAYGEPCNACGLCCMVAPCPIAARLFGPVRGVCPALRHQRDGTYSCGVMEEPRAYAPVRVARFGAPRLREAARIILGAGEGCDCRIEGEPSNAAFRDRCERHRETERTRDALYAWGLS